jgi:hypothetical protein
MLPKLNNICECCDGDLSQAILQLFDDKCFKIVDGVDTLSSFCLGDFAFPVDSHSCLNFTLNPETEIPLFDNEVDSLGSPAAELVSGNLYVRGIMIRIVYPTNDDDGEEISITDKNVELWIEDAETLDYKKHPLHSLFMIFTNPKSNDPSTLINRIKIVNSNSTFKVKVIGLIMHGLAK